MSRLIRIQYPRALYHVISRGNARNKNIIEEWLGKRNLNYAPIQGAFYAFIDFSSFFSKKIKNSTDLAYFLLENAKVVIAPGVDFGVEYTNYARISLCLSSRVLTDSLNKIDELFK